MKNIRSPISLLTNTITAAFLLIFSGSVMAHVDILSSDGDVYLAWSGNYQSTVRILNTTVERTFYLPEVSIGMIGPSFEYLAVAVCDHWAGLDSLYVLEPSNLETVMSREIALENFVNPGSGNNIRMSLKLSRNDSNDSGIWVSANPMVSEVGEGALHSLTARYVPDPTLGIVLDSYMGFSSRLWYGGIYYPVIRPIFCGGQNVPTHFTTLSFCSSSEDLFELYSGVHQPYSGSDMELMDWSTIWSCTTHDRPVELKAAGSYSDEILLLWATTDTLRLRCSTFDGMTSDTVSTYELDFDLPLYQPWAMSCNREDDGLLLAWVQDDSIMCRHYSNGWNPEIHTVQYGVGNIYGFNFAVCSDSLGYWIAWMDGSKSEPEVLFVDRGYVTGIESSSGSVTGAVSVRPEFNPASGDVWLDVVTPGIPADISVYDMTGRMVHNGVCHSTGQYCFSVSEKGVYLIHVSAGSLSSTCMILCL
ncbi:MAG: T9SS type A sorting domain-containing protein [Candidatus Aegiribacteria sp.]|nr:T9SS type A sorting domain-containing protein [Candidatus Aegiribacteria sp.]